MRKIPTVFVRDPDDRAHVTRDVTPGCEWVLAGEGTATRKYDGTCVMFDGGQWWARREVKPGKNAPAHFVAVETDEATGKTVGWEPVEQSPFAKFHTEALAAEPVATPGTYELCGPKVNGNPEAFALHVLVPHADADIVAPADGSPRTFDLIRALVLGVGDDHGWEGIVYHHPDGRMAKIKQRDFTRA